jgi:heterodisulfide reductase subunit D
MSKDTIKDIEKVITTGPPVSGIFSPDQENLLTPITLKKLEDDYERCLQCGYCRAVCRVYNVTQSERDYAGGRNRLIKSLKRRYVKFDKEGLMDTIYRCMLCGNCAEVCPAGLDTLEIFHKFRENMVKKGVMPAKLKVIANSITVNNNPFLESGTDRFNWCDSNSCNEGFVAYEKGKELFRKIESGEYDPSKTSEDLVGYFVGCTASYRNNELVSATCRTLDKMGVDFIVFPDEKCCGSMMFRTGLTADCNPLLDHNIDMIRKTGIKKVVFSCSGCFSTFSREYVDYANNNLGFELYHMTQFVPKYAKEKNLTIKYPKYSKENPLTVTYHDPCHLGRFCNVYDEPRELINMIEGLKLTEMKHNRNMSWCCGAGGGFRALYGDLSINIATDRLDETMNCWENINQDRLKEALETKADTLLSGCVFCKNNLSLAAEQSKSGLKVLDITQILEDCEIKKE